MIDSYSFGHVKINGKVYTSDVIIYPERINSSWWRKEGHNLCMDDIQEIIEYKPEILVIGKGTPGLMRVSPNVQREIEAQGIGVYIAKTAAAVEHYNTIYKIKKAVAALHLTC
ncbi:MAG: Mth938-like domain-containing protein [bacterium]